jgi:uncharacterized protein
VFLDTNVLVSAIATRGICADLLRSVASEHELVVGEFVLAELRRVLAARFHVPVERIDEVEAFLRTYEVVATPDAMDPVRIRDPADRWVLANARAAEADVLITGDGDLLAVAATAGLRIVTPREFWEELRRGTP